MTQQRLNNLAMLNMNYDVARSLEFAKMVKGGGGGGCHPDFFCQTWLQDSS